MRYDLGYIDLEARTLQPLDKPFGPRLSPMSWVRSLTHVSGLDMKRLVAGARNHHYLLFNAIGLGTRSTSCARTFFA
jgi:hypothetical protein